MTITHSLKYHKPQEMREILSLLAEHGDQACILAGGTDVVNWLREDVITPEVLIDIKGIELLKKII